MENLTFLRSAPEEGKFRHESTFIQPCELILLRDFKKYSHDIKLWIFSEEACTYVVFATRYQKQI